MNLNLILGDELYLEVQERLGGLTVSFPYTPSEMLNELFGEDKAGIICQRLGGDKIYIKQDKVKQAQARQNLFIKRYDELVYLGYKHGKAVQVACREFGFSDRWGDKLLKRQSPFKTKETNEKQLAFDWCLTGV